MDIAAYLNEITQLHASGQTTEHSFRPALHKLFQSIDPKVHAINEPKKSDAGMPDFMFMAGEVPIGWCEAKDIDKDVIKLKGYSVEQRKRYELAKKSDNKTKHVPRHAARTCTGRYKSHVHTQVYT